jgi:hypothetical protein
MAGRLERAQAPVPAAAALQETSSEAEESTAHRARHRDPQAWLRQIEQLRTDGKVADAEREWRAFVKAYPSYAAPAAGAPTK